MLDLEAFRVGTLPSLYYIPDAISPEEEQQLLCQIRAAKQAWKTVSGERGQGSEGSWGKVEGRAGLRRERRQCGKRR